MYGNPPCLAKTHKFSVSEVSNCTAMFRSGKMLPDPELTQALSLKSSHLLVARVRSRTQSCPQLSAWHRLKGSDGRWGRGHHLNTNWEERNKGDDMAGYLEQ